VPLPEVANGREMSTLTHGRHVAPTPRKLRFSGSGMPFHVVFDTPR
jgi:hypothetical protein